jgi:hypothetical protein
MKARDNPLSTDRVLAIRYRPQGWTWPQLLARLESMNYRCAIVGPKGTGKTTLLEDLSGRLPSRGLRPRMIRLSSDDHRINARVLRSINRDEIILLDGAEQLSAARWAWLRWRTRRAAGLVITTHTPGRLPTLIQTQTTPALLAGILADLLPTSPSEPRRIEHLFAKHHGNLRDALRELYDEFASAGAA